MQSTNSVEKAICTRQSSFFEQCRLDTVQKRRHQTHGGNKVNSRPIFKMFSLSGSPVNCKFAAKYLLKIPPHLIRVAALPSTPALPCETLMSESEWQSQTNAVINDKLQGTDVTYLKCGGIFNNQITSGLLSSLPVNFLISESWHSYEQKGGFCRAFSSTFSMVATRTFLLVTSPYMHIAHFNFFHWQTQQ